MICQLIHRTGADHSSFDRPAIRIDHPLRLVKAKHIARVRIQRQLDRGMIQHPFKQRRIALLWHALPAVLKISVILTDADRHTRRDRRIDLLRLLIPLLHRIMQEDVLIDITGDHPDLRIVVLHHLQDRDAGLFAIRCLQPLCQRLCLFAEHEAQRTKIERHRDQPAMDRSSDLMRIRSPFGKPRQKAIDLLVIRMKDMRTIRMDQDPMLIQRIMRISPDMRPSLDDPHMLSRLCQLSGDDCAGKAAADHDSIHFPSHPFLCYIKLYHKSVHLLCRIVSECKKNTEFCVNGLSARPRHAKMTQRREERAYAAYGTSASFLRLSEGTGGGIYRGIPGQ